MRWDQYLKTNNRSIDVLYKALDMTALIANQHQRARVRGAIEKVLKTIRMPTAPMFHLAVPVAAWQPQPGMTWIWACERVSGTAVAGAAHVSSSVSVPARIAFTIDSLKSCRLVMVRPDTAWMTSHSAWTADGVEIRLDWRSDAHTA